ncbi:MAG: FAD-binding protein, partial [Candidatus Paceibacterota bacterium]
MATHTKRTSLTVTDAQDGAVSIAVTSAEQKAKKPASRKTSRTKRAAAKATKPAKATKKKTVKKTTSTSKALSKQQVLGSVKREPLGHLLVEHALRDAGFRGTVSTDKALLDKYSTDESVFAIRPQIVLQPKDQHDIETAVQVLGKQTERFPSLSLTPRAAGTGLSGGSLTDSVVIDVSAHMDRIDEPQKKGGTVTITCQPGAMWKDVEAKLKK